LEYHKKFYFFIYFFNRFTNKERADGHQDHPIGQDDTKGEFIAEEGNEQFSEEDDLSRDTTQPHQEQRNFER